MTQVGDRRPLASRETGWASAATRWLAGTPVTPNQISIAGIGFALLAGGTLWLGLSLDGWERVALLLIAALGCQLRLLCNLLDGLVAVEAGRGTADGAFWNEAPDRISDIAILVGLGLGVGLPALGWAAATLAVLTAYLRELGRASGLPADYRGPMAKQQRMALVTIVALLSAAELLWGGGGLVAVAGLWLLIAGTMATAVRRAVGIVTGLRAAKG